MSSSSHSELLRLETFSDGVFAIILTIMVLELKIPTGSDASALTPLVPVFLSYMLSFVFIAVYWNNHHHLLRATEGLAGTIMWANIHLLFWISLIPFCTGWLGEHPNTMLPTALYGIVLLCAAFAYKILQTTIVRHQGQSSALAQALGSDVKGYLSLAFYIVAIITAFFLPWISYVLFVTVTLMWIIPDRRLSTGFTHAEEGHHHS